MTPADDRPDSAICSERASTERCTRSAATPLGAGSACRLGVGARLAARCVWSGVCRECSAFWDSSAFVKLLIEEPGRDLAVDAWNGAGCNVAWRLAIPEVSAALAIARRTGRLEVHSDREARRRWAQRVRALELVELASTIGDRAADLVVEHALSGADAVHLASVLTLADADPVLITWDPRLAAAAHAHRRGAGAGMTDAFTVPLTVRETCTGLR